MSSAGIYIHIPFCRGKCPYCDFYSVGFAKEEKSQYLIALTREIGKVRGRPAADTLYLGGGTPSLLTGSEVAGIIDAVRLAFDLSPDSEITLELNPGDCTRQHMRELGAASVNRLSVGVQSLFDPRLKTLGRRHTAEEARAAIRLAQEEGFHNISADLMTALPYESPAEAEEDARALIGCGVTHLSAYMLKIMQGTPFGCTPPPGLPDDDKSADCYLAVCRAAAEGGFVHYEISNFARPGCESRHNLKYWMCGDYYAFGPSAAGCIGGRRYRYKPLISSFIAGEAPESDGCVDGEDYIICSLRTRYGLSYRVLEQYGVRFDSRRLELIERCVSDGLMQPTAGGVRLTERGFLVSNSILSNLI